MHTFRESAQTERLLLTMQRAEKRETRNEKPPIPDPRSVTQSLSHSPTHSARDGKIVPKRNSGIENRKPIRPRSHHARPTDLTSHFDPQTARIIPKIKQTHRRILPRPAPPSPGDPHSTHTSQEAAQPKFASKESATSQTQVF